MALSDDFFGLNMFAFRRCIAGRAKCKTHDTIPAAHRLRSKVDATAGKTNEEKLVELLRVTGLQDSVSANDLLEALVEKWWTELKPLITPYDRDAHASHPRSLPIRRKYKKAKEYWAKYMLAKKSEFDEVVRKYKCKDVKYPYLTIVGTLFEVQMANRAISEWPLKSNLFDINDEDCEEELDGEF
jgi:hypothetical protein